MASEWLTLRFIGQITESAWHTNNRFNHFEAKKGSANDFLTIPGHLAVAQDVRVQKFRIWHHISKKRCGPKFDSGQVSKFSYFNKSVRQQPFVSKYQFLGCAAMLLAQPHHHVIFFFFFSFLSLFLLFSTFCLLFHCCWCCWCCCCHCWCCAVAEQVAEQFNCKFCHSLRSLWDWKTFQSCYVMK